MYGTLKRFFNWFLLFSWELTLTLSKYKCDQSLNEMPSMSCPTGLTKIFAAAGCSTNWFCLYHVFLYWTIYAYYIWFHIFDCWIFCTSVKISFATRHSLGWSFCLLQIVASVKHRLPKESITNELQCLMKTSQLVQ